MTRWEVTKAIRKSDLPAPSRLLMLTLADSAETGTAEIPPNHTPSIAVLARETGLGKSTVKEHLTALEAAGWLVRSRPDKKAQWAGERTCYRLDIPGPVADLGQETAETRPEGGQEVGQEPDLGRPGDGHQNQITSDQSQTLVRSSSSRKKTLAVVDRADVENVCKHLADRIEANGSKRPAVTKTWRDAARRLIDKDGRTVEQIIRAIDWCQDDTFWKGNIMSMPTLREKYDRLRLAAQRTNGHKPSTTDQRVAEALAAGERVQAQLDQARKGISA